jgi:hypothetical protein
MIARPPALRPSWVRLSEALAHGLPKKTAHRAINEGRIQSRKEDTHRLVLVSDLPEQVQARIALEHLAPPLSQERADDEEWCRRLGRFDEDTRQALRLEAGRRAGLLERFEAISPRWTTVDGRAVPTEAVRAVLADWPARDPIVLYIFPSWSKAPSERTLRNALEEYRVGGALRLVRAAWTDDAREALRCEISAELRSAVEALILHRHPHATFESIFRKLRERFGAELPSKQTIRRFIAREFPQSQLVYEQKGPRTFRATVQEPILQRDLASIELRRDLRR